jgi:hypothetical protein
MSPAFFPVIVYLSLSHIHPELFVIVHKFIGAAAASAQEFTNTTVYYEDRSGIKYFANGSELHFTHNITFPNYIYALSINLCEVLP